MAARKKKLADLVRDRSFLRRRHEELLLSDPLVREPGLRQLQEHYRRETNELERRELALTFERAVRDPRKRGVYEFLYRPLAPDELLEAGLSQEGIEAIEQSGALAKRGPSPQARRRGGARVIGRPRGGLRRRAA